MKLFQWQKKSGSNEIFIYSGLVILLMATGCSEAPKSSKKPVPPPSASAVKQPIAATPAKPAETQVKESPPVYAYNPTGRRDPFMPLIVREERKTRAGVLPPLERYGVNEFKLTGIVWGGFGYNAVIEGPDGKGYFIHVGTVIGPNRGVVKKITRNNLLIEEKFKNSLGEMQRNEIVVELRRKQEGTP